MTILDIDLSKGLAGFLIALWFGISVPETLAPGVTVAEDVFSRSILASDWMILLSLEVVEHILDLLEAVGS